MNYGIKGKEAKGYLAMTKNNKVIRERYFNSRTERFQLMRQWLKIINYKDCFQFIIKLNEQQQ